MTFHVLFATLLTGALLAGCTAREAEEPAGSDTTAVATDSAERPTADRPGSDSTATRPAHNDRSSWSARPTGLGPISVGMPLAVAMRLIPELRVSSGDSAQPCFHVSAGEARGASPRLMIVDGTVARVEVDDSTIATAEGARVGDDTARVMNLYKGRVRVEPHNYVNGSYLIVSQPADTVHRIVFETDGKRVTRYRAGRFPEVEWVEGCS